MIKSFTGDVQTPLFYMPEALGYDRVNCEINRLFFRIEDLNGEIIETFHLNLSADEDDTKPSANESFVEDPNIKKTT